MTVCVCCFTLVTSLLQPELLAREKKPQTTHKPGISSIILKQFLENSKRCKY